MSLKWMKFKTQNSVKVHIWHNFEAQTQFKPSLSDHFVSWISLTLKTLRKQYWRVFIYVSFTYSKCPLNFTCSAKCSILYAKSVFLHFGLFSMYIWFWSILGDIILCLYACTLQTLPMIVYPTTSGPFWRFYGLSALCKACFFCTFWSLFQVYLILEHLRWHYTVLLCFHITNTTYENVSYNIRTIPEGLWTVRIAKWCKSWPISLIIPFIQFKGIQDVSISLRNVCYITHISHKVMLHHIWHTPGEVYTVWMCYNIENQLNKQKWL